MTLAAGSMVLKGRFIRVVSSDDDDGPDDPPVLTDEGFDDTLAGEPVALFSTTAATVTGAGSLTHSDEWQISGGLSMKWNGTSQHYIVFGDDYPAHDAKYMSFYLAYQQAPTVTVWIVEVRDTNDLATAWQLGINPSGQVVVRPTNSGAVSDTSVAMTLGGFYRVEATSANGVCTVRMWDEANINSTTAASAFDTLTCTITATSFSNERVGNLNLIAGAGAATGNLQNESFAGVAGSLVSSTNKGSAAAVLGAGSLTYSSTHAQDGTTSLLIDGTTFHYLRFDATSHNNHFIVFYYRHVTNPGANATILQLMAGDTTTVAAELAILTTGAVRIRNASSGTVGAGSAAQSTTLLAGQWYRFDLSYLGAGDMTCRFYTGANLNSTVIANATETLTCTMTATNFSRERVGLIQDVTTGYAAHIDIYKSDNTALPQGSVESGGTFFIDRFKTAADVMPAHYDVQKPKPPGYSLVPQTGALFGVTAATTGVKGSTSPSGLTAWLNATGNHYPHIIGRYYSGTRSWVFNAEEKQLFDPTTGAHAGKHAIPLLHWKLNGTWAQVANGAQDAAIDQYVAGIRQYNRKIFQVLPHHEPELEIGAAGSGMTAADYRAMHRHFVTRVRNQYLPDVPNIEFVMQYTGYSNFADTGFEVLYAGDDVVDWIGWDPYPHSFNRNTFDELLNETLSSGGVPSYTGFYDWARATHPTKPLMLSEWGLDVTTTTGMGQANVSTVLTNYRTQVQAFPEVKAVVYWNSLTANGNYQMQGTTCGDEMSALIEIPWYQQDLDLFP